MKKKNIIILIVLLAIGFAAVSTTLIINGTIGIGVNKLGFEGEVIFTKAETEVGGSATINSATKREITYVSKVLRNINETSTLNFEVSNYSRNYDAVVKINCIIDEENEYANYIKLEKDLLLNDGEETKDKYIIEAGERKQGYVKATLIKSYVGKETTSEDETDEEDTQSISITCTLNVEGTERDEIGNELIDELEEIDYFTYEDPETKTIVTGYTGSEKEITIPDGVIAIAANAFKNIDFTKVMFPESVTEIGENAFAGCNDLNSISFNNYKAGMSEYFSDLKSIKDNAFQDCSSLTEIDIPHGVTEIGANVFSGCTKLTIIYYHGDIQDDETIKSGSNAEVSRGEL
ncbi:MAG: leucine-rich repeat domain-containing protein [Erysipelotrichales bacterium]|nr:leucine-rich repeat domain-containing protein [Erysipelotrichales bacterium]